LRILFGEGVPVFQNRIRGLGVGLASINALTASVSLGE
jgi:hypothetical protein